MKMHATRRAPGRICRLAVLFAPLLAASSLVGLVWFVGAGAVEAC